MSLQMPKSLRSCLAVACAASLALAGCDLEFPEEEVLVERDAAADTLDLFVLYRGVTADDDSPEAIEKAVAAAERILGGRRQFMFLDWPFHFDLDSPELAADAAPEARRLLDGVTVERAGACLDRDGRLSGYQRIRFREASAWFDLVNAAASRAVLEAAESGELGDGAPWLDARSRDLLVERARSGRPWVTLERNGVEIDVPVTAAAASGALRALSKENDVFSSALVSLCRYLKVDAERTIARFGDPEPGGLVRFSLRRDDVTYSPALLDALAERGLVDPRSLPAEGEARRAAR